MLGSDVDKIGIWDMDKSHQSSICLYEDHMLQSVGFCRKMYGFSWDMYVYDIIYIYTHVYIYI